MCKLFNASILAAVPIHYKGPWKLEDIIVVWLYKSQRSLHELLVFVLSGLRIISIGLLSNGHLSYGLMSLGLPPSEFDEPGLLVSLVKLSTILV